MQKKQLAFQLLKLQAQQIDELANVYKRLNTAQERLIEESESDKQLDDIVDVIDKIHNEMCQFTEEFNSYEMRLSSDPETRDSEIARVVKEKEDVLKTMQFILSAHAQLNPNP